MKYSTFMVFEKTKDSPVGTKKGIITGVPEGNLD